MEELIGYQDRGGWIAQLDGRMPEFLDFDAVSRRTGVTLSTAQEDGVRFSVEVFAKHWVCEIWGRDEANEGEFGHLGETSMPASDFEGLVERIERASQNLSALLSQLSEFDRSLLLAPHGLADAVGDGPDAAIDRTTGAGLPYFEPALDDFFDYLAFRRYLSYFSAMKERNEPYNNSYSERYVEAEERHSLERLFRHIMAGLERERFPMGVAVPTDANPDCESPIIALLLEVQAQLGRLLNEAISLGLLPWKQYNYRQMCRLASANISDFRQISEEFERYRRSHRA
ncbi:hypothetical protein [Palleronia marisminoris]|uniref:hypothetical protein n=1 Tax=Palleronia marisminoris TaxID=315423 RepID=UPI000A268F85|nr:hypothetical protein [Palleronia marisminoris]